MSEYCPYTYGGHPSKLHYPQTFPMPSEKERDLRWQAIRKTMAKHQVDCLIISVPRGFMPMFPNQQLCYVSNFAPFYSHGTFLLFPREGEPRLSVNSSIGPQFLHVALETSWISDVTMSLNPIQDIIKRITMSNLDKSRIGIVGYRSGVFPAISYESLRETLPGAHFDDASALLAEAMNEVSRKSEEELSFLRKACSILDLSFNAVAEAFKPGVREYELWAAAEYAILNAGGWYSHFMLATSGANPTFPRAPASHQVLQKGDLAMFEINVTYAGITPQISFALSLGKPKAEIEKMFRLCDELYAFSLSELEKRRKFLDIEQDLALRIHEAGYEPLTPQIHVYNVAVVMPMDSPPQPGDYFTVHPNMCDKNCEFAAKFGDAVRMTSDGKIERLQKTPARLHIL